MSLRSADKDKEPLSAVLQEDAPSSTSALLTSQMEQFFDATTDAILFLDHLYVITFLNRRALELLAPAGDLRGRNLFSVFPEAVYEGSPFVEIYGRSMNDRIAGEFEAFYPDPLNIWFRVQSYPAKDGIIIFFRDISQEKAAQAILLENQKQAERQLDEVEVLYRTAPIGLALIDPVEFRYLRLNDRQAAFYGIPPQELVGKGVLDSATIPGLKELFEQVAAGKSVRNFAIEGALASNPSEHRHWAVNYSPVFAEDGSVRAISAASLEITQQKRAEQALIQNEKLAAVGRLASSISHEINNPLEAVTNLLYLGERSESLSEVRELLAMAATELRRASAITNQTLRFHRQATKPMNITYEGLMESVVAIHHGRLSNVQIAVEERKRAHDPVCCYEGEIRQVLNNLVGNAIDAMPAGGKLYLRSRWGTDWKTDQKGMYITVADDGPGMSQETVKKAFEPFFTTKGLSGSGLGLWISQEIIVRHKGKLRFKTSQGSDRSGTTFSLFLPANGVIR
jgi:signal transduction histidine kinase